MYWVTECLLNLNCNGTTLKSKFMKYLFTFPYIQNRFLSALPAWKDDIVWAARIFNGFKNRQFHSFYGNHIISLVFVTLRFLLFLYLSSWFSTFRCIALKCAMAHESLGHSGRIRIIKCSFLTKQKSVLFSIQMEAIHFSRFKLNYQNEKTHENTVSLLLLSFTVSNLSNIEI